MPKLLIVLLVILLFATIHEIDYREEQELNHLEINRESK